MAFVARFMFDVPFGRKQEFFRLHEKWRSLSSDLGFPNPEVLVGSIGAPESRIEIDYRFESLAALEATFAKVASESRMAEYQQEMAALIVPGSHRWDVYRIHAA